MSTITTKDGAHVYYKDWGAGEPIVFSHGWPLSADVLGRADDLFRVARVSVHRARPPRPWAIDPGT
jgi:pimeloyl-ACP methyl ester carboxylesterase